jgi:hypothetical protein
MRGFSEPLVGLGAAPQSSLPSGMPGAPGVPSAAFPAINKTALCTVPGATTPLLGITGMAPNMPGGLPGGPPLGRAGRIPPALGAPIR